MKRITIWLVCLLIAAPAMWAFDKKNETEKTEATTTEEAAPETTDEIHWMDMDDVQVAMKKEPKRVYVDIYTSWCSWCKVMDKKTFTNPNVIKYINENFYAVRLNAEQKGDIRFMGKMYGFNNEKRANDLAVTLMGGNMSYPTTIIMDANFQNPRPIPNYLDVPTIEMVLKYFIQEKYRTTPFDQWQKDFKATWN